MKKPEMRDVKGDGIRIHIAEWKGDGPPVVMIHGLTANCMCWDVLAESLGEDHHLIAPDLRGRGRSDHPQSGYSVENHAGDVLALLDDMELAGSEKKPGPILMGHSLGAVIALAVAAKKPEAVSKIILLDGGGILSPEETRAVVLSILPSLERLGKIYPSFEALMDEMKKMSALSSIPEEIEAYFRYDVEETQGGVRSVIRKETIDEEFSNLQKTDVADYYGKVKAPVLIVRAMKGIVNEGAVFVPQNALNRMLSEMNCAEFIDIPDANHYTIIFKLFPELSETVRDFIRR